MVKKKQHHGTVSVGAGCDVGALGLCAGVHRDVRVRAGCHVLPFAVDQFFKVCTVSLVPRKRFDGLATSNASRSSELSDFFAKGSKVTG
jgi:hypothetical protein